MLLKPVLAMQVRPDPAATPVAVRVALPSYAFIAWRGLFTSPAQLGPLLVAHRRQPGVGRRGDRPDVLAVHAP